MINIGKCTVQYTQKKRIFALNLIKLDSGWQYHYSSAYQTRGREVDTGGREPLTDLDGSLENATGLNSDKPVQYYAELLGDGALYHNIKQY